MDGWKKHSEVWASTKNELTKRTHSVKIIEVVEHDRRTSKSMSEMINELPPSKVANLLTAKNGSCVKVEVKNCRSRLEKI